jgi:hypothetical protein
MITTQAGKYTPLITLADNVSNASVSECFWVKFGKSIRVSGELIVSTTDSNILSKLTLSLPESKEMSESWQITGTGVVDTEHSDIAAIIADNSKACILFKVSYILNNVKISFSFSYSV